MILQNVKRSIVHHTRSLILSPRDRRPLIQIDRQTRQYQFLLGAIICELLHRRPAHRHRRWLRFDAQNRHLHQLLRDLELPFARDRDAVFAGLECDGGAGPGRIGETVIDVRCAKRGSVGGLRDKQRKGSLSGFLNCIRG